MSSTPSYVEKLTRAVGSLQRARNSNLLILYYAEDLGTIVLEDADLLFQELRRVRWNRENPATHLDVLIHTRGGDPEAGYRMAQAIRDASDEITVLVPKYAYSAGTLLSFCADEILLGDGAGLSPIDITWEQHAPEDESEDDLGDSGEGSAEIELLSLDNFRDFAIDCRVQMEQKLRRAGLTDASSDVEAQLLVEMAKQVGTLNIGQLFRERTVTQEYATTLLRDYMLNDRHNRGALIRRAMRGFIFTAPSHDFHLDYHSLARFELPITELSVANSDIMRDVIEILDDATEAQEICKPITERDCQPFIQAFPMRSGGTSDAKQSD